MILKITSKGIKSVKEQVANIGEYLKKPLSLKLSVYIVSDLMRSLRER